MNNSIIYIAAVASVSSDPNKGVRLKTEVNSEIFITGDDLKETFDIKNQTVFYKSTDIKVGVGDRVLLELVSLSAGRCTYNVKLLLEHETFSANKEFFKMSHPMPLYNQVQIGASLLYVPPDMIKVERISTTQRIPSLRAKGSIKRQTGHTDTRITISLIFPDPESVNDPLNGLRALIAQFKRTPFVPIFSRYLNDLHNIEAVCLHNIVVSTIPNFPGALKAELICFAFDHTIFMPGEPLFATTINWKLFTWYFQRNLVNGETRLVPISGKDSSITFHYVPEEDLRKWIGTRYLLNKTADLEVKVEDKTLKGFGITGGEENLEKYMVPWEIPDADKVIVSDIAISYQNIFSRIPVQMSERPAYQFLGSQDVYAKVTLEVLSDNALISLRRLFEYTQRIAREYRFNISSSFLSVENEVFQLFGVKNVFIDTMTCSTVPNFPGRYFVELTFIDFDVFQSKRERAAAIMNTEKGPVLKQQWSGSVKEKPGEVFNQAIPMMEAIYWSQVEKLLAGIDVYPDLELPTYEVLARETGIEIKNENGGIYVDPDFYINPTFTKEPGLKDVVQSFLENPPEITFMDMDENRKRTIVGKPIDDIIGDVNQGPFKRNDKGEIIEGQRENLAVRGQSQATKTESGEGDRQLPFIVIEQGNPTVAYQSFTPPTEANTSGTAGLAQAQKQYYTYEAPIPKEATAVAGLPIALLVPGENADYENWKKAWIDLLKHDKTGRMIRAFPTAHVFIIDEGQKIGWYRLWDNFYGLNAISSIEVIRSRKMAADTAIISISNIYENFTDRYIGFNRDLKLSFMEKLITFLGLGITQKMKEVKNDLEEVMGLRAGARIQIRMGYGNNLADMPILFNGTVTEISTTEVISMVAQGDGIELCNTLNYSEDKVAGTLGIGAEPFNLLLKLLTSEDRQGLSLLAWYIRGIFTFERRNHVAHFGAPVPIVSLPDSDWKNRSLIEVALNIYPGNGSGKMEGPIANDEYNVEVLMGNKTIWDIAQILAAAVPNYIATVEPFQFRSTLFYGKPHWEILYDYDVQPRDNKEKAQIMEKKKNIHPLELNYKLIPKYKPLMQWHVYSSFSHIVDNKIKATAEGMYTDVICTIKADKAASLGHSITEPSVTAYADKDIYPHIRRTTTISSELYSRKPFAWSSILTGIPTFLRRENLTLMLAQNIAASTVRDYVKDMYQGDLIVIGDPTVKPYDAMYIADHYNEMYGACFVKQVVHQFSVDTGYITNISPDAACMNPETQMFHALYYGAAIAGAVMSQWFIKTAAVVGFRQFIWGLVGKLIQASGTAAIKSIGVAGGWLQYWVEVIGTNPGAPAVLTRAMSALYNLIKGGGALASTAITAATSRLSGFIGALTAGTISLSTLAAIGGVLLIAGFTLSNIVTRYLRTAQCVILSLLSLRGREFSAGINGHRGITAGIVSDPRRGTNKSYSYIKNMFPEWFPFGYSDEELTLDPELIFNDLTSEYRAVDLIRLNTEEERYGITEEDVKAAQKAGKLTITESRPMDSSSALSVLTAYELNQSQALAHAEEDRLNLAAIIWGEARGEPMLGKLAVGAVVVNRVKSSGGKSLMQVISAPNQFSAYENGSFKEGLNKLKQLNKLEKDKSQAKEVAVLKDCLKAADQALAGADPTCGAMYFYNPKYVDSSNWIRNNTVKVVTIGNHVFAIDKNKVAAYKQKMIARVKGLAVFYYGPGNRNYVADIDRYKEPLMARLLLSSQEVEMLKDVPEPPKRFPISGTSPLYEWLAYLMGVNRAYLDKFRNKG